MHSCEKRIIFTVCDFVSEMGLSPKSVFCTLQSPLVHKLIISNLSFVPIYTMNLISSFYTYFTLYTILYTIVHFIGRPFLFQGKLETLSGPLNS